MYQDSKQLIVYVKSGEVNIILGDWNAKVGHEQEYPVTGRYGLGARNDRGAMLMEFCKANNYVIANTLFQHHTEKVIYMEKSW